jgi:hypothetical protein
MLVESKVAAFAGAVDKCGATIGAINNWMKVRKITVTREREIRAEFLTIMQ